MKNEIAREVGAILSKEYGGSSKRSFQLARSIVKLVADRLTKRPPDECHEAACDHKFTPVTNTLEICVLCGIRR